MAEKKLTKQKVELIKHLVQIGWKDRFISELMKISRIHCTKVRNNKRWAEVNTPSFERGQELFYRYTNNTLDV